MKYEPNNSNIYCNIGLTYLSIREYKKAFDNLKYSIKFDKNNDPAYVNLNQILRVIKFNKFSDENVKFSILYLIENYM